MKRRAFPIVIFAVLLIALTACAAPTTATTATLPPAAATAATTAAAPSVTTAPTETPTVMPTETPAPSATPVVGVAGERSIGDTYMPEIGNTGYDVQQYTLRLALDPAVKEVSGSTRIEAISTLDNLVQISLDFAGFEVQSVTLDGTEVQYSREQQKLIVDFPAPLANGAAFALEVTYQGAPLFEPSKYVPFIPALGLQYPPVDQPTGSLFVVAEPNGAHYWFPCNDHPRDKATFRIELTVPEGLAGAANGKLIDTQKGISNAYSDGRAGDLYVWEENFPMATYLATAVVGPYERIETTSPNGVALRSYVFADQKQTFEDELPVIGDALDWMSQTFGRYPFDTFGYAQVISLGASLETQTLVILDTQSSEATMVHEMSHMWFGDWVSLASWQDIWRNEGFATYIAWMWAARDNPALLDQRVAQMEQRYQENPSTHPLNDPPPGDMFGVDSYYRGALLVNDLRKAMGEEAFFQGLQNYLQQYGGGTASFDQFKAVMDEATDQALDAVFEKYFK